MIIQASHLSKLYRRGKEEVKALDQVTLQVDKGEFVAILGPSGSGKSTLMNLLGLLDRPSSGELFIAGQRPQGLSERDLEAMRRKTIGFVFQQFLLVPTMTALQNVMLPMYFAGRRDANARATELLGRVGLSHRLNHVPAEMSGGEIQRVAVARALANDPQILLADEPTGNLDSKTAQDVVDLLKEINGYGTTVIVVTHNTDLAAALPRTITLRDGRIISDEGKTFDVA